MNDDLSTVIAAKKRYPTSPSTSLYGRIDRVISDDSLRDLIDATLRDTPIAHLVQTEITAELRRRIRRLLAEG